MSFKSIKKKLRNKIAKKVTERTYEIMKDKKINLETASIYELSEVLEQAEKELLNFNPE